MNRVLTRLFLLLSLLVLVTCSSDAPDTGPTVSGPKTPVHVGQTKGGAVVLSRDEKVAVVCNRTASVVTILTLDPLSSPETLITSKKEIDLGPNWEPWAAVIGADDDTAYVISRRQQVVFRILHLHTDPFRDDVLRDVVVGSEPTGIVITPSGARLFVANWGEGTVSVITTFDFKARVALDLNVALAKTGLLGNVEGRPALAHPRALAITDNGDLEDGDETLYATEFFSQPLPAEPQSPPISDAGPEAETCALPCEVSDGGAADSPSVQDGASGDALDPDSGDGGVDAQADAAPAPAPTPSGDVTVFDRNREGLVYPIKLSAGEVGVPISIAPVANTGFQEALVAAPSPSQLRPTSCFPNQLYAAAASNGRLYVTSMCASPVGPLGSTNPLNFKTVLHPTLFVIDTERNIELPQERVVLTQGLEAAYADDAAQDRRFPLIPNDVAVGKGPVGPRVFLTAFGADAVFDVEYEASQPPRIGTTGARFLDLHARGLHAGGLPVGIVLSQQSASPFALVANDVTQNVSVVDLDTSNSTRGKWFSKIAQVESTAESVPRAAEVLDSDANSGRRLFATGLDAWSFQGEAWLSCEGCHPDGLSDGVTWFFARGPRRTISTAATYDSSSPAHRRVLLWTGNVDEVHDVEGIVRTVAGGMGGLLWRYPPIVPSNDFRIVYDGSPVVPKGTMFDPKPTSILHNNLNGSTASLVGKDFCPFDGPQCDMTGVKDWNQIDAFIRTVRAPRAPTYLDPKSVAAGESLFRAANCAGCHGGPTFTLSRVFYTPGPENNGSLPYAWPATSTPDALSAFLGRLRLTTYDVAPEMQPLNPPGKSGSALIRPWSPGADPITYAYNSATAGGDQINCVLRSVGTFPEGATSFDGIVAPGSPAVLEVRQDMKTRALGASGFNVPSLIGLATNAPYFHAGNARTLEEAFDSVAFAKHYQALDRGFLDDPTMRRLDLVAYLLSIDDDTKAPQAPKLTFATDLCASAAAKICAAPNGRCP